MSKASAVATSVPTSNLDDVIDLIYAFASDQDDVSRLLLGLSKCISVATQQDSENQLRVLAEQILPHFKNAIQISEAFSQLSHFQTVLQNAIDRLPFGAGVIDEKGRLLYFNNRAADAIDRSSDWTRPDDCLKLRGHSCGLSSPMEPSAVEGPRTSRTETSSPLVMPRGGSDLQIIFTELDSPVIPLAAEGRLFYFCINSQITQFINAPLLEQVYRLTPAEIKVTEAIIANLSTQEAANTLALKQATIRDHLSSIYAKLNVQRKPDLIRKVLFTGLVAPHDATLLSSSPAEVPIRRFTLPDGRCLSYREYGPAGGRPVLLLHNVMGSSLEPPPGSLSKVYSLGVRLIVPERPGYGDSDPLPGRSRQDICHDLNQLLKHLDIAQVDIMEHSIGTQYAIACAEFLTSAEIGRIALVSTLPRVKDIRSASSTPSLISNACRVVRYAPFLIKPLLQMLLKGDIESFYENQLSYLRPQRQGNDLDYILMQDPAFRAYCIANFTQSARQGLDAWADELKAGLSEWDFEIRNTRVPYQIWHGNDDKFCTPEMVHRLAQSLNVTEFRLLDQETHYLFSRHFDSILENLIR